MSSQRTLLVLVEPGARLPESFGEERRESPDHVVVVACGTLRADDFAVRTIERIKALRARGRPVERILVVTGHEHPHESRIILGRALVEQLSAVDRCELLLTADGDAPVSIRHELLGLAGELMAMEGGRGFAIRVRFEQHQADELREQAA